MADPADPPTASDQPLPQRGSIAARAMGASRPQVAYLNGLNAEQRRAVETIEGPVLVLAGAGTGKTRVLTTRIAHILGMGQARPSQILAVTFTNKAAREMRERIESMVGNAVEGMPWLGTFHSIGVKILRRHAELVGKRSDFTILDTADQIRLIKQVIQAEGLDEKRWPARQFAGALDHWKNRGWTPKDVPESEARAYANGKGRALYATYQARLQTLNACDFGDLLLECIRLFRENDDILADYQRRFRFMLVDEYQDTNIAQYLWLRLLSQSNHNVCCVGDDDQSIYGWRGAEVDNILRFEQDYPGALVIRLERNYRSTQHILAAASHLISFNESRLGKTLFTEQEDPDAERVSVASAWDSDEEARAIGDDIEALQSKGHKLDDMAILMRASFQMREFEDRFATLGLNYRVIGGPRFYERAEIRDALAYLRVTHQAADDLAFERIVNVPKRGLGDATLKIVHDHARRREIPLLVAARELVASEELKPKPRNALRQVVDLFARWSDQATTLPHTELAEIILDESGYTEMWQNDKSPDAPGRLENLKELVRSMEQFENLQGFLEHISLVMDTDSNADDDAITLMTLHAAKGLEFETVYLPGWEEGLFPHQRALDEGGRAGLEEERRLAYVGLTRAKQRAKLWFAANRRIHGMWQTTIPSRFVDELPEAHVDIVEQNSGGRSHFAASRFDQMDPAQSSYSTPGWARVQKNRDSLDTSTSRKKGFKDSKGRGAAPGLGPVIEGELVAKSVNDTQSPFAVGERVFHQKFGYGEVALVDGNKLTIHFDKAGQKRVLDSFLVGV